MEVLAERPTRRRVQLILAGPSKTYPVADQEVADFLAHIQPRKLEKKEKVEKPAPPTPPMYLDPMPAALYPLPDQPTFAQGTAARLAQYKDKDPISCQRDEHTLFNHQKILLDYLNIHTPYRGLLVYHGLGSGKTCSSIAVAEGFVHRAGMKVWVLTPKSLEGNYRAEMLKCSDTYRRAQHWAFSGGQWQNSEADPNYDALNPKERAAVDKHIEAQINHNYTFVHYNGLNCLNFKEKFQDANPFDNTVVVVDEVHALVARISASNQPHSPFRTLYEWFLSAANCRIVALSGTPLVDDPREFGILYNLIRGYISVWRVKLEHRVALEALGDLASSVAHFSCTDLEMVVTRAPPGFTAVYADGVLTGVQRGESRSDDEITHALQKFGEVRRESQKLLPDTSFEGVTRDLFVRRIAGLTSYFPDAVDLMPVLHPRREHMVEMSAYQWTLYQSARELEGPAKLATVVPDSFRSASRAACNFVFPENVKRPVKKEPEDECDADDPAFAGEAEKVAAQLARTNAFSLQELRGMYSPKFATVLDTLKKHPSARQLVFSNFVLLEGLRFFAEALNANGYERLVLEPTSNSGWEILSLQPDRPKYVTYAGSDREKEMYLDIFNKNWGAVPEPLHERLQKFTVNLVLMPAVEGVSLANVTHVHLLDPYWHPTRFVQAIGRARRLCQHSADVKDGVTPHVYLMKTKNEKMSTDTYLYKHSKKKEAESHQWLDAVRQASL